MNDDTILRKIETPGFIWLLYPLAFLVWGAAIVAWPILNFPLRGNVWGVMLVWLIFLVFLAGTIREFVNQIKVAKLRIGDGGLQKVTRLGPVLVKWQEVARYECGKHSFTLFFRNGERIQIPKYVKHFEDLKNYCLQKLEQIGTFEDGRKVSRIVFSISYKTAFLFLVIIAVLIGIISKLAK